jgi:cell division inhibitor SepF
MSGAMRRIGEYLGLLEDTGYDDYDPRHGGQGERTAGEQRPVRAVPAAASAQPAPVADISERRRPQASTVAELSRITMLHPRTYNEARAVGENYRDGTPVIMKL